jgi:hypothetical protein
MTQPQHVTLAMLVAGPITPMSATVLGVRRDLLDRLCDKGWARWCPYAAEPSWQITPAGRDACRNAA